MVYSTGSADAVEIVAGAASDSGVLVPEELADDAGVGPGDVLTVQGERGDRASMQVSGVYVTPTLPLDPYWQGLGDLFLPTLSPWASSSTRRRRSWRRRTSSSRPRWPSTRTCRRPGWSRWTTASTSPARARPPTDFEELQAAMADPESPVTRLIDDEGFPRPAPDSALPGSLETVDRTVGLLSPPVRAVGIGGGIAALVLVGAWAGQRVRRRDGELRSLVARGLSPARGAGQAAAEAVLPVVLGLGVGGAVRLGADPRARAVRRPRPRRPAALPARPGRRRSGRLRRDRGRHRRPARPPRPGRSRTGRPAPHPSALAGRHRGDHRRDGGAAGHRCRRRPGRVRRPHPGRPAAGDRRDRGCGHRPAAVDRPARGLPAAPPAPGRLPGGAPRARRPGRGPAGRRDDGAVPGARRLRGRARRLDRPHDRPPRPRSPPAATSWSPCPAPPRRPAPRPRARWSWGSSATPRWCPATGGPTSSSCTPTRSRASCAGPTTWPTSRWTS